MKFGWILCLIFEASIAVTYLGSQICSAQSPQSSSLEFQKPDRQSDGIETPKIPEQVSPLSPNSPSAIPTQQNPVQGAPNPVAPNPIAPGLRPLAPFNAAPSNRSSSNVVPPPLNPTPISRNPNSLLSGPTSFDYRPRVMPHVFSDSPSATLRLTVFDGLLATSDLPLAGGARRMKVATDNRALPQDRILLIYQKYADALTADASRFRVGPAARTTDLDQWTLGYEKSFYYGLLSLDVRMPVTNSLELATPNFGVAGGHVGNLNVKFKAALIADQDMCLSVGTGWELPTGSSVSFQGNGQQYVLENDAYFIQPFIAYEERYDLWFLNAFASIDAATNGNRLRRNFVGAPNVGSVNEQTLAIASIGAGRWLFLDETRPIIQGFALTSELHYTTTLQDTDFVFQQAGQIVAVFNQANRNDHLSITVGGQLQVGLTSFRFGFVQPLRSGDDKLFEHEFNIQINRLF